MEPQFHTIFLPTRPQPDTIVAIFLLKTRGGEKYPGIEKAAVKIMSDIPSGETLESLGGSGVICIDLGGGKFDHHGKDRTASSLVAEDLELLEYGPIAKLLAYAERDDKFGKGTVSDDPLDRAFGLSGLIAVLNRAIPNEPNDVVNYVLPLLWAHHAEERQRIEEVPLEFEEKMAAGRAVEFETRHKGSKTKVVIIESDNPSMIGWIRSGGGRKADVIAQKTSSGHVNILTRQFKRIDLRGIAAVIRDEENRLRNRNIDLRFEDLARPGKLNEVPEWYYDRATNSLLNGSLGQKNTPATLIPFEALKGLIEEGFRSIE